MCLEKERKKERKREREREKMREGVEYPPAINIAINDFFRFYIYKKIFNIPSPVGKGKITLFTCGEIFPLIGPFYVYDNFIGNKWTINCHCCKK